MVVIHSSFARKEKSEVLRECGHCHEEKPLTEFHRDKSRRDGLQSNCKPCNSGRSTVVLDDGRLRRKWAWES
jgi:hypothetical protein